jgi:hypothetical protein
MNWPMGEDIVMPGEEPEDEQAVVDAIAAQAFDDVALWGKVQPETKARIRAFIDKAKT